MKILAIGPFIGSFEEEILTFRPYARWLSEAIEWDKIYLSTHINRIFLYDFVPEENIIPVFQQFSRDEENQVGYVHRMINKKDYLLILKTFKDKILEIENCNRKDIEIHNLSYTKTTTPCSYYKKIFEEIPDININIKKEHENKIIFIPSRQEKLEKIAYIKDWLMNNYDNVIIVGSTDTWFSKENVVLNKIDYFENGWKYNIQYISKAKAVICPLGYWTTISNLQQKSVFSWGENPGQYRPPEGIYNFGNKNVSIIPADNETSPNLIIKSMNYFIKEINK